MSSYDLGQERDSWADLDQIESYLRVALTPVLPRPQFVDRLREEILAREFTSPFYLLPRTIRLIGIGALALISSVLLVLTGIRAIIAFLGALGLVRRLKRSIEEDSSSRLRAA